jgi:hypothetical protein
MHWSWRYWSPVFCSALICSAVALVLGAWQLLVVTRLSEATVVGFAWTQSQSIKQYQVHNSWTWFRHQVPQDAFDVHTKTQFYDVYKTVFDFYAVDYREATHYKVARWVHVGGQDVHGTDKTPPTLNEYANAKIGDVAREVQGCRYYLRLRLDSSEKTLSVAVNHATFSRAEVGDRMVVAGTALGSALGYFRVEPV